MEEDFSDPRTRLLYIIKMTGLNKQEFAYKVDVSQSTISQITSTSAKSRNSNISENVVNKVISAFPQLNIRPEWLLNGTGPMNNVLRQDAPSLFDFANQQHSPAPADTTILGTAEVPAAVANGAISTQPTAPVPSGAIGTQLGVARDSVQNTNSQKEMPSALDVLSSGVDSSEQTSQAERRTIGNGTTPQENIHTSPLSQVRDIQTNNLDISGKKSSPEVERVIIFYSDGRFADYRPRKK